MNFRPLAIDQCLSHLQMLIGKCPEFRYGRQIAAMDPVIRHKPAIDASWMLRYRFESRAALDRHLRHGDGFYVPAPDLPGVHGSRLVVELLLEGDP